MRLAAPWLWLLLGLLVPGAWSTLSEEQEELLVELHNHYRGQVSPSASAMLPLVRSFLFISSVLHFVLPTSPLLLITDVQNLGNKEKQLGKSPVVSVRLAKNGSK